MLKINKKFAIKRDGESFTLCKWVKDKQHGDHYRSTNWFPTLNALLIYMIDYGIDVPKSIKIFAKEIETLKSDVEQALNSLSDETIEL
jgi:hypothetical protein